MSVLRQIYRIAGLVLVVASCAFFAHYLARNWSSFSATLAKPDLLLMLLSGAVLYQVTFGVTALGNVILLKGSPVQPGFLRILYPLLISQFAKYLPGNVAHHMGRATMLKSAGFGIGPITFMMIFEIVGAILAAACVIVIYVFLTGDTGPVGHIQPLLQKQVYLIYALIAVIAVLIVFTVHQARKSDSPGLPSLAGCLALYVLNFVIWGGIMYVLTFTVAQNSPLQFGFLTAVFAIAWVAGFVTPGAPGGIGVREVVMIALTSPLYGADVALALSIGVRVITTLGDLIGLLIGLAIRRHLQRDLQP